MSSCAMDRWSSTEGLHPHQDFLKRLKAMLAFA